MKIFKRIWHTILNAIAWVTHDDNAELRKSIRKNWKLEDEVEIQRQRPQIRRF